MSKYLKRLMLNLRRALPLLVICGSTIAFTYWALDRHYRSYFFTQGSDLIYAIESRVLDLKIVNRGTHPGSGKVGILAIDEKAIDAFGSFPFQRKYYYQALKNLKALGVSWVGFDVIFSEPQDATLADALPAIELALKSGVPRQGALGNHSQTIEAMLRLSPSDEMLGQGIASFEHIVAGYFYFGTEREARVNLGEGERFGNFDALLNSEIFADIPAGRELADYRNLARPAGIRSNIAAVNNNTPHFSFFSNDSDDDAINRWVTLVADVNGSLQPSLGLKLAAEYMDREIMVFFNDAGIENISLVSREDFADEIRVDVDPVGSGRVLVNHRGPGRQVFHHFSLADAYHNSFSDEEREKLKGAVLLLGATATGTNDIRPNPFDPSIDGVENHAAVVDNLIAQDFLRRPFAMYEVESWLVIIAGILFAPIVIWGKAVFSGFAAIAFLVCLYFFDHYYWFQNGVWAYLAVPSAQVVFMFVSATLYKYMTEEREKAKVKGAFQHYLSSEVIDQMLDSPDGLKLGGERREITVYFSDVRDFTNISEMLSPEALCEYMNEYFTPMTDVILRSGGTLDKYIGDAIMAFWGAPVAMEDQADRAAMVAFEHLLRLDVVQKSMREKGFPPPEIGIGLNTGPASVGNMGSNERFTYTAMGDSVNLGARLEGLTKEYGIKIMISEFTRNHLSQGKFYLRDLDDIRVKGKSEPVRVYELMRPDYFANEQLLKDLIGEFELARKAYLTQNWDLTEKHLTSCLNIKPDDGPSNKFLERLAQFRKDAPGEKWDGVYTFKHK